MSITVLDNNNFESEIKSGYVLVDFWAPWCSYCIMLEPALVEYAENNTNIKICKLNVDDNPETAAKYGITMLPTLLIFKDGEVSAKHIGGLSAEGLEDFITGNIT